MMNSELSALLSQGLNEIAFPFPKDCQSKLERFFDELVLFNPAYKLVSVSSDKDIVIRHILDCLAPVNLLATLAKETANVADLGSGSGLPGFVLSTAFDKWTFNLVERMGRRASFLRSVCASCSQTDNTNVVEKDLSEVRDEFDLIVFRAFKPLKGIIGDLDRILSPNGCIAVYKSSEENIEEEAATIKAWNKSKFIYKTLPYRVPFLEAKRNLLVISRA